METFYTIVIIVAIVILILLLTIIGIILSQKNNAQVYPPSKNTCPDYWTASVDNSGNTICVINDKNKGIIASNTNGYKLTLDKNLPTTDKTMIFTPGFNSSNNSINFKDPMWATSYGKTQECSLNKWTNENKIIWDGISNYNGC